MLELNVSIYIPRSVIDGIPFDDQNDAVGRLAVVGRRLIADTRRLLSPCELTGRVRVTERSPCDCGARLQFFVESVKADWRSQEARARLRTFLDGISRLTVLDPVEVVDLVAFGVELGMLEAATVASDIDVAIGKMGELPDAFAVVHCPHCEGAIDVAIERREP